MHFFHTLEILFSCIFFFAVIMQICPKRLNTCILFLFILFYFIHCVTWPDRRVQPSLFIFSKVIWKAIFIIVSIKVTLNYCVKLQWRHTTRLFCPLTFRPLMSFCLHNLHCMLVYMNVRLLRPIGIVARPPLSIAWSNRLYYGQTRFHFRKQIKKASNTLWCAAVFCDTEAKSCIWCQYCKKHRIQKQVDYY